MNKIIYLFFAVVIITITLVGCSEYNNTIQSCIVANTSYTSQNELESVTQTDTLTAGQPIFASIHFIESPKGMKYTVKWYLDETEIISDTKATEKNAQDIVVYELKAEHAITGTLKLEVIFNDTVLLSKELEIK